MNIVEVIARNCQAKERRDNMRWTLVIAPFAYSTSPKNDSQSLEGVEESVVVFGGAKS
jgi:hypothetical protein